jgi:hypothetical protein
LVTVGEGTGRTGLVHRVGPFLAVVGAMACWLWPLGVGGRMPVGGDVTQFSIGLMAVLHRALRAGRLPLWNDLWGFGFPGVAESQMGVFYPPHLVLYGFLPTELAYTLSLVIHTLWGALGASWAARRFGVSRWGAALSAVAWAGSGFFLIHLPHQWGYTVGSWMPWAWGLGWTLVRGEGGRRTALGLAGLLALQVLPGHFQVAFCTQVGLFGIGLWALAERSGGASRSLGRCAILLGVLAAVLPLAALQLWPTYRLARLADARRDYEYLSGFAVPPQHLISYVAPGLFHRSPFWRPLAWDPFRTSPEEHLGYIGLVPLLLSVVALWHGLRRDPAVRCLAWLAIGTLILSFGPNAPGFEFLIRLPGFSFFRAPARWGLATELALALLAGKGFDALATIPRPRLTLAFVLTLALAFLAGTLLTLELTYPFHDPVATAAVPVFRDDGRRWGIYAVELAETGAVSVAALAVLLFARRRTTLGAALFAAAVLDLVLLGRHKPVGDAPIRPLIAQSSVLGRLAREPRGTRVLLEEITNLPQAAEVTSLASYRTLDLPVVSGLVRSTGFPSWVLDRDLEDRSMMACGAAILIIDPAGMGGISAWVRRDEERRGTFETINDPALTAWMFGPERPSGRGSRPTTFGLWRPRATAGRAWLLTAAPGAEIDTRPKLLDVFWGAVPLVANSPTPERVEVAVRSERPGFVLLTQLDYPEWRARWEGPGGTRPATIERVFGRPGAGAWQGVALPGPGSWTLAMEFEGRDVRAGLLVSAAAWILGIAAFAWPLRRGRAGGTR